MTLILILSMHTNGYIVYQNDIKFKTPIHKTLDYNFTLIEFIAIAQLSYS